MPDTSYCHAGSCCKGLARSPLNLSGELCLGKVGPALTGQVHAHPRSWKLPKPSHAHLRAGTDLEPQTLRIMHAHGRGGPGTPARLIRERYRKAAELSKVRGKLSCLLINDIDAGLGHFENTQVTVRPHFQDAGFRLQGLKASHGLHRMSEVHCLHGQSAPCRLITRSMLGAEAVLHAM